MDIVVECVLDHPPRKMGGMTIHNETPWRWVRRWIAGCHGDLPSIGLEVPVLLEIFEAELIATLRDSECSLVLNSPLTVV